MHLCDKCGMECLVYLIVIADGWVWNGSGGRTVGEGEIKTPFRRWARVGELEDVRLELARWSHLMMVPLDFIRSIEGGSNAH